MPAVHIQRDGIERIAVGFAGVDDGRGFVQHIRLEKLICEGSRAGRGNAERAQPKLREEWPAVDRVVGVCAFWFRLSCMSSQLPATSTAAPLRSPPSRSARSVRRG